MRVTTDYIFSLLNIVFL